MLKSSPVLTASANTSPTTFRYAPARSPHSSPRNTAAKQVRRPPPPSVSSQGQAAAALAGAAQAAMLSAPSSGAESSSAPSASGAVGNDAPPAAATTEATRSASATTNASSAKQQIAVTANGAPTQTDISPPKRRGSPSTDDPSRSVPENAKRIRQDQQPDKLLPQRYELCAVDDMVELIAHMINELIATNDAIHTANGGLTRFHSRTAPGISVRDYLHRLAKHATLTPPLLLAMVYYIDRLCALYPEFTINTLTVHRFLITAATVAAKGLSDSFWNNTTYARVGGVRVAELKLLELEFLYRVDWKIVPNPEVLVAYYSGLVERTPGYTLGYAEGDEMDDDDDDDVEDANT